MVIILKNPVERKYCRQEVHIKGALATILTKTIICFRNWQIALK
jgi:hypothetical protein